MTNPRHDFIVDGHSDFTNRILEQRRSGGSGALAAEYVPSLRAGLVRVVAMQVGSDSAEPTEYGAMSSALEKISYLNAEAEACPEVRLLRSRQDLEACLAGDQIGLLLTLEGCRAFGHRVASVSIFHQLGLRMAQLTWNNRNLLADGSGENHIGGGLSSLGIEVVREMGRLRMLLDVSHLSDTCISSALAVAKGPVVASHCGARSVCDHVRNLTDEQLRALADTGGVIGVNFFPGFLRKDGRPGQEDVLAHMNHLINVAGEDAVGLGPDFIDYMLESSTSAMLRSSVYRGSGFDYPVGLESTGDLARLPDLLAGAGYSDARTEKILRGNWLRVYREALV